MNAVSTSPTAWAERYEALRQHARESHPILGTDPLGLILVVRQGVAGWMRCWGQPIEPPIQSAAARSESQCPTTPLWQNQLTALLAQMTAAHLQPSARP